LTVPDFDTLQQRIEKILERHPSTRGSYKLLVPYTWFYQTGHRGFIEFNQDQLELLSSSEAITRSARRIYWERPDLAPPAEVQDQRDQLQTEYRRHFGGAQRV